MPTSSDATFAVRAEGLGKAYRISRRAPRQDTLRDLITASFGPGGRALRKKAAAEPFWALKDVSFTIGAGENVGILGLNGAGKSTLLKVLSRITAPSTGGAKVNGRMGSLLEVGTGFHGELTGRENIFLYGAILGMTKAEITAKFDRIVDFASIEDFIDMPVKRYSSGMYVRLAFSVAAHLEPDILLLDEVLSVGDLPFQRKCMEFAKSLQKRQATILFVSHNMFSIKSMCDRVIYLRNGQVVFDGPTDQGIGLYEADCRLTAVSWASAEAEDWPISITDVEITNEAHAPITVFEHGQRLRLRLDYEVAGPVVAPSFIVSFVRSDGVACCAYSSELDAACVDPTARRGVIELLTPPLSLVSELYRIEIVVREKGFGKLLCAQTAGAFHISHPVLDMHFGVFHEAGAWAVGDDKRTAVTRAPALGAIG